MGSTYAELGSVLGFGGLVSFVCFVIFVVLRQRFPEVYAWRCVWSPSKRFDPLPAGYFSWIPALWRLTIEDVAERIGTDAAGYVAMLHYMVAMFCTLCVIVYPVIVPLYRSGTNIAEGNILVDDWEETVREGTISNVKEGSWRLHVVAAMIWVVSLVIYLFLYVLLRRMVQLRQTSEVKRHPLRHYTVLVEDIPQNKASIEAVRDFFNKLLEGEVQHIEPVKSVYWKYCRLYDAYVKAWRLWKAAEEQVEAKPEAGPPTVRVGCCCQKVQAIPYYKAECDKLRPQLDALRHNHEEEEFKQAAFVTFRSLRAASFMQAAFVQGSDDGAWRVAAAPEPRDIVWSNLEANRGVCNKAFRIIGVNFLALFIVLYWAVPVAFTQTLLNLHALAAAAPGLQWIEDLPQSLITILQGLLPVWALAGLNAAAVPLFLWLSDISGLERRSTVHISTMWMNYGFLMFNSFFIVISTGATLEALGARGTKDGRIFHMHQRYDSVSELVDLLGHSLPNTGAFFMNFIAGNALYIPIALAFPFALFTWVLYGKFLKSRKERHEAMDPYAPWYGQLFSQDAFIFSVAICFALVSPGVLIFTAMYFIIKLTVYKYLLLFYYRIEFETGGRLLMSCVMQLCFGTFLGQMTVMSILRSLNYQYMIACAPLPLLTVGLTAAAFTTKGGADLLDRGLPPVMASKVEMGGSRIENPTEHCAEHAAAALFEAEVSRVWLQPFLRMSLDCPRPRETFWLWEDIKDSDKVHAADKPPSQEVEGATLDTLDAVGQCRSEAASEMRQISPQPEARGQASSMDVDRPLLAGQQALLDELHGLKLENQRLSSQLGAASLAQRLSQQSREQSNGAEAAERGQSSGSLHVQTEQSLALIPSQTARSLGKGGCAKDLQSALARATRTICPEC